MNNQEFLSASLPYRLKFMVFENKKSYVISPNHIYNYKNGGYEGLKDGAKIIIRNTSDLTKECVQADYNEGKPFIPIEIIRLRNCMLWFDGQHFISGISPVFNTDELPTWVTNLLIKWHFWPNMPKDEEVVYITDEFNPYK
jgi:hypothetical protein